MFKCVLYVCMYVVSVCLCIESVYCACVCDMSVYGMFAYYVWYMFVVCLSDMIMRCVCTHLWCGYVCSVC